MLIHSHTKTHKNTHTTQTYSHKSTYAQETKTKPHNHFNIPPLTHIEHTYTKQQLLTSK